MRVSIDDNFLSFEPGTTYRELLPRIGALRGALGIRVRGVTLSLSDPAEDGAEAFVLTYDDEEGRRIFERTALFVLLAAARRVMPDTALRVEHSLGSGLYVYAMDRALTFREVEKVRGEMRQMISEDLPILRCEGTKSKAIRYYEKTGQADKLGLMKYREKERFNYYKLDGMNEYFYGEMAPSAGFVSACDLLAYHPGMMLLLPSKRNPNRPAVFVDQPKISGVFSQSARWNAILGCTNAADLNAMVEKQRLRQFIRVNEALHERSVQQIADQFAASGARVVLIAGPSSSGKTTFSHRLMIALQVLGYQPVKISLDDYYIDRDLIPLESDGTRDLERIDILDLDLLNEHLLQLLRGEVIQAPEFDFVTGKRKEKTHPMEVGADQPIIIEGIHGMNDELTCSVPRKMKFKIYVSALTTINLDNHNRIRTTDARLLRRIVRDYLFRGTPPEETMMGWNSVRRGEGRYIFPYQEQADVMFNTSLVYELPILKKYVYPLLRAVSPESPCYTLAMRLVKFLDYFLTADVEDEIPVNSILREFIGGCCFYRDED